MRLKNTVKILRDDGTWEEVPGEVIPYTVGEQQFNLLLHESIQPWSVHELDVSEESTGCLCANTGKPVNVATKKDAEQAFSEMLEYRGVHAVKFEQALLNGDFSAVLPHALWVGGYAAAVCGAAIFLFTKRMKEL